MWVWPSLPVPRSPNRSSCNVLPLVPMIVNTKSPTTAPLAVENTQDGTTSISPSSALDTGRIGCGSNGADSEATSLTPNQTQDASSKVASDVPVIVALARIDVAGAVQTSSTADTS